MGAKIDSLVCYTQKIEREIGMKQGRYREEERRTPTQKYSPPRLMRETRLARSKVRIPMRSVGYMGPRSVTLRNAGLAPAWQVLGVRGPPFDTWCFVRDVSSQSELGVVVDNFRLVNLLTSSSLL